MADLATKEMHQRLKMTTVYLTYAGRSLTAVFSERDSFPAGITPHLATSPNHLHCFDSETGQELS